MRMDEFRQHVQPSTTEWAFTGFMRLLALLALAGGVFYWVRLIGLRPGLLWRFDLMPWMWQTAAAALAVLLPVAATGLWMRAPWGAVLWFGAPAVRRRGGGNGHLFRLLALFRIPAGDRGLLWGLHPDLYCVPCAAFLRKAAAGQTQRIGRSVSKH